MKLIINRKKIIVYIFIIDLLFLPYFKLIKSSISSIILLFVIFFCFKKYFNKQKYLSYYLFIFTLMLSFLFSISNYPEYLTSNLSRLVIITLMVLFYIYFNEIKLIRDINIKKILYLYLLFNLLLAIIYYFNIEFYFNLKNIWSLSANYDSTITLSIISRFCGIVSDPNNCACSMIAICCFLDNYSLTNMQNIMKNFSTIIIVFMTMSVSGLACLGIYLLIKLYEFIKSKKICMRKIIYFFVIIFALLILVIALLNSEIGKLFIERININTVSNDPGRIDRWRNLIINLDIYKFVFSGFGGTIVLNGNILNPHNGFLYILYNYGLLSTCLFIFGFIFSIFSLKKKNFYYIFFIINFILNTVIIDYRATMIYVILFVFSKYINESEVEDENCNMCSYIQ